MTGRTLLVAYGDEARSAFPGLSHVLLLSGAVAVSVHGLFGNSYFLFQGTSVLSAPSVRSAS